MLHQCASCHIRVFSTVQKFRAGSARPIVCPHCGALNTSSAWAALLGSIAPLGFIFVLWVASNLPSWLAFVAGLLFLTVASAVPYYFIPLVLVTPRSVRINRALLLSLIAFIAVLLVWWGINGFGT